MLLHQRVPCKYLSGSSFALSRDRSLRQTSISSRRLRLQAIAEPKGFHQTRLAFEERCIPGDSAELCLSIRPAETDKELLAASYLRAVTFFAYPPERAFAGKLHQQQVCAEEFEQLCEQRNKRRKVADSNEKCATLVAVCQQDQFQSPPEELQLREQDGNDEIVVGSLDVHAVRALPGEVLIGNSKNAAYLANVCVWSGAQRRGVGAILIEQARQQAQNWGADGLFVHMMAVNERARSFYDKLGFRVEKEESSNEAHYRGRCLDGVEGRARSILMRDSRL